MTNTKSNSSRFARLQTNYHFLSRTLRGIEKEGLRTDQSGKLACTPHSPCLGSALTHAHITTDYSESLLELITGIHTSAASAIKELADIHRYVYGVLEKENIWTHSMPAFLPSGTEIPIAWYGTSNMGMLKHIYRRGLAVRYGKKMQCIAGVHYNFSLPDEIWGILDNGPGTMQERQSRGYIALIRNFTRYSWLLIYLFGATPAFSCNFIKNRKDLMQSMDKDTLYLPYATSLRMGNFGYQGLIQPQLLCYNDFKTFLRWLHKTITESYLPYSSIGTHFKGEWIQLNTNLLQTENEYYSHIRPKRIANPSERPLIALARRGIQYVEVRCIDIDPYTPLGITEETCCFIDAFLLFCAVNDSPFFSHDSCLQSTENNFSKVVTEGRKPGLKLNHNGEIISLYKWGKQLLEQILPYAALFDSALGSNIYAKALATQFAKLEEPAATPSACFLKDLRSKRTSFHSYVTSLSQNHAHTLRSCPLSADFFYTYREMANNSLKEQLCLEHSTTVSFTEYLYNYHALLRKF